MANAVTGRILHVDLTTGTTEVETPPESFYRTYLGGSAMGVYYILRDVPAGTHGLDPANVLTFMLSPLTGVPIAGQSRMTISARSPLVDGIGDSQGGGFFPAELRFAGFTGIVVKGRAAEPVYLWIQDGEAELRPAAHLWGMSTAQTTDRLREELGDAKVEVAAIGPAGERLAPLAAIMNMANRANGRTGMGAVMGSKNLKAVVVRGHTRKVLMADPATVGRLAKWGSKAIPDNGDVAGLQQHGTQSVLESQHAAGGLPTFNYNAGQFEGYEAISGETMTATILTSRETCYSCAVRCKRAVEAEWEGRRVDPRHGGPEYETASVFGSYCGVDDLAAIALANQVCNEAGLDTIGTGATVAWAMECYTTGVLSEAEIGFPAPFGDAAAMVRLVDMIVAREGIGDVLANGSRRAADLLGKGHENLITVKGSEAPAHMPQAKRSLGVIYAVNPFGADHQSSEHDPMIEDGAADLYMERLALLGFPEMLPFDSFGPEKVRYALKTQQFYSFLDTAALCQFVWGPAWSLFGPQEAVDIVRAVTGWDDFDLDELMEIGERRINMLRAFNAREGIDRSADTLPAKFFRPLTGAGPTRGVALDPVAINGALDEYYRLAGWDPASGNPTPETLHRLGLAWVS
ncbi:MAG TPA: aldehyde ferredoxin oxidoreductase family protein [Candidatus Limnocylindrales bacterium]|nr:aldehyde ferredoxin oxidoreductase family protein [Candidatus Limnocylindrales bacterium]